jgi:hypothetical protein
MDVVSFQNTAGEAEGNKRAEPIKRAHRGPSSSAWNSTERDALSRDLSQLRFKGFQD